MMTRWRDRVALVTGASEGIGRGVARRLAAEGLKVAACARNAERLASLKAEIEAEGGVCLTRPTDLRSETERLALFELIRSTWGGVDLLVNNAGLGHDAPLMSGRTDHWQEMLEVNVLALAVCTREAVNDMRRRGDDGHIVHLSSMSAHRVPRGSGMYSATKYAVRSLTEGLRMELRALGSRIRITAVSPGNVVTEFAARMMGSAEEAAEYYSQNECLEVEDIVEAVIYAVSQPERAAIHDILLRPTTQIT